MSQAQFTDLPFFLIAPFLEGMDVLSVRLVNSVVKSSLVDSHSEEIWSHFLKRDFKYAGRKTLQIVQRQFAPTTVFGTASASDAIVEVTSAFEAWVQWKAATNRYLMQTIRRSNTVTTTAEGPSSNDPPPNFCLNAPYFLRAAEIWARFERALSRQQSHSLSPGTVQTALLPGKGYRHLDWSVEYLQNQKLHALQALLAFYGGQELNTLGNGIFGGFSVYDYATCTSFMEPRGAEDAIWFAACPLSGRNGLFKYFFVDTKTGHVKYNPTRMSFNSSSASRLACPTQGEDAILDWMDEYVRRLETKYYQVGPYLAAGCSSISLFPQPVPGSTTSATNDDRAKVVVRTVTRGVEVVISSVYSPWTERVGFTFVYSIRLRLLTPYDDDDYMDATHRGFLTCQLKSRHWRLTQRSHTNDNRDRAEHVDGDGVVGNYPLLKEGSYVNYEGRSSTQLHFESSSRDEEGNLGIFSYQSCTDGATTQFGGYLLFVPGSLAHPTGDPFEVPVGPLVLDNNPDYLY